MQAHHVWSAWEFAVLINCIAATLFDSGWIWVHYVALEPTVDDTNSHLVKTSGGRITDARVDDLLVGRCGVGRACAACANCCEQSTSFT